MFQNTVQLKNTVFRRSSLAVKIVVRISKSKACTYIFCTCTCTYISIVFVSNTVYFTLVLYNVVCTCILDYFQRLFRPGKMDAIIGLCVLHWLDRIFTNWITCSVFVKMLYPYLQGGYQRIRNRQRSATLLQNVTVLRIIAHAMSSEY